MANIDINCKIRTYPDNDLGKGTILEIKSHWNYGDKVHVIVGKEHHIVIGADLIAAVEKCMNSS